MTAIRSGEVTLKGNPIDIRGPRLKPGDAAPAFSLQAQDLSTVTLASSTGKTRILLTVPSLDTPVCNIETKKFNETAAQNPHWAVLCASTDLPFAQKRWCGAEGVTNVQTLSAHANPAFGEAYGVLIASGALAHMFARAVFVIGPDDRIRHVEYVKEIAQEPDYAAATRAAAG